MSAVDPTEYDAYEHVGYEDEEYLGENVAAASSGPGQIMTASFDEDRVSKYIFI